MFTAVCAGSCGGLAALFILSDSLGTGLVFVSLAAVIMFVKVK